jgi:hypothetical protein
VCSNTNEVANQIYTDTMPKSNSHLNRLTVWLTDQLTNYLTIETRPQAGRSRVQILAWEK